MAKLKAQAETATETAPKAEKVKKVKVPVEVPPADGKQTFEGMVGEKKYLFDAGNGETILELVAGSPIADQAQAIGRALIPRSKASKYALNLLFKNWRAARPAKPTTAKEAVAA